MSPYKDITQLLTIFPTLYILQLQQEFCTSFFIFINLFILFIYFWLRWVFFAVHGLSLVVVSGGYSLLWCTGFSLQWLLLLRSTGSRCAGFSSCGSQALERRLSSCSTGTQLLRSMWDLSGPGLEPMSPILAGGFLTTAPPGKPGILYLLTSLTYFSHSQIGRAHV